MDLKLEGKLFVVTGATSGFGRAIAITLIDEGAHVILNARGEEKLNNLKYIYRKDSEYHAVHCKIMYTPSKCYHSSE